MLCDLPATIRDGRYHLIEKLGHGGFGVTYRAVDTATDRPVAVKMFWPHHIAGAMPEGKFADCPPKGSHTPGVERLRRRFLSEAKVMSHFDCPNVVRITDYFMDGGNAFYIMEWIDGCDLDAMVRRAGPLPLATALRHTRAIARGLDYLHRRHHAHLDIKPANVMIERDGCTAVIIDFGITRQYFNTTVDRTHAESPSESSTGFAPPELYTPTGIIEFSPELDVYSLAATLYFMLTGLVPPSAQVLVDKPLSFPPACGVPQQVAKAITAAMTPHRRKRPATTDDFMHMLPAEPEASGGTSRGGLGTVLRRLFSKRRNDG